MTFWHRGWDTRTCYAEEWLKQRPQTAGATASAIGTALGQQARERWRNGQPPDEDGWMTWPEPGLLAHFGFAEADFRSALAAWRKSFGVLRVGIDTNVLSGMDEDASRPEFYLLLQLHLNREISVAVSNRYLQDKLQDPDPIRVERHRRAKESFDSIPGPARCDESFPGDIPTDGETLRLLEGIFGVNHAAKRPNLRRDVDHIFSTLVFNRDYFLTWERGLINKSKRLPAGYEARVVTPFQFLLALDAARTAGHECEGLSAETLDSFMGEALTLEQWRSSRAAG